MADGTIGLPLDGPGKKLDTEQLVVSTETVQRERMQVAGKADVEIAEVRQTDPTALDGGLVTRPAPPDNGHIDFVTSVNLAAGASVDLDAVTIPASTTGKLMRVTVSSSLPCKWAVKTRDGAAEMTEVVFMTGGLAGGSPTFTWTPNSKELVTQAGAGVDENFRVTATNLDANRTADVYATIEWDEV